MKTCSFCGNQNADEVVNCSKCRVGMLAKGASKIGTMKSIQEMRRFEKLVVAFLRSAGAVDSGDKIFPLQIETKAGLLIMNTSITGVNGRFQDVRRSRALLNPTNQSGTKFSYRSGSWMHQYYESPMSADEALEDFKRDLIPILSSNGVAEQE